MSSNTSATKTKRTASTPGRSRCPHLLALLLGPALASIVKPGDLKMPYQRMLFLFALLSPVAHAQWLNYPTPGIPRTPDGKPNLTAPAPRTADGKPDLSGVWFHEQTPLAEMQRLFGADVGLGNVPGME